MAKVKCKGTLLKVEIATVMTTVGQVIELDKDQDQIETFDADTLDNAAAFIPKEQTGRSSVGGVTGTLFYDPALANHQFLTDTITTPAKTDGEIVMANGGGSKVEFEVVGIGFGLSVKLNDGLKAPFSLELNSPVWPT